MQKRLIVAVVLLLVIVAGLIAYQSLREREPVYAGKSLRAWLREYDGSWPRSTAAEAAIRQIGTNAIPTLLKILCEKNSISTSKLGDFWGRHISRHRSLPTWVRYPGWYLALTGNRNSLATVGFKVLGADAQQAVPALIQIYERNISPASQQETSLSLIGIGPAGRVAIPSFLRGAASPNQEVRRVAVVALSALHAEPQLVVPALVKSLSDTNDVIRLMAVQGLQLFGPDAQQAIPAVVPLLTDSNLAVRLRAADALKAISPEAAAGAGSK